MRGAIPPLPNTSSWRGAQWSTGTTLPLLFILMRTALHQLSWWYIRKVRMTQTWLTPWSIICEKLGVLWLVKKFSDFGTTWNFITMFIRAQHWHLSSVHSLLPYFCKIHSNIIVRNFVWISHISHACYMPHTSNLPLFDHPNNIWWRVLLWTGPHYTYNSLRSSLTSSLLGP
jgi:hypothetical protein